jgi:glycosyltransferase involved in cell wall biosynthesis/SAM-dependent methyltransferase
MKIHILYKFVEGPWGGGNQFLKALREYFRKAEVYSESAEDADVTLFNSYPFSSEYLFNLVFKLKNKSNKILIHRVDGPIFYGRGKDKIIDEIIFKFNNIVVDGTVFQSNWCRKNNYELGMKKSPYETVIINAPDTCIFNSEGKKPFDEKKIKLIAVSWSSNIRKGFDIYKFLDEHLDFNKYEMTFVGNSSIEFKKIKWIKPVSTKELAKILKEHDIYITASRYEACPNTLIEALHCGLPAVSRNRGVDPEILSEAVELFEDERNVINAIEKVAKNYNYNQQQINMPTFDEIGERYYKFAQKIYEDYLNGDYRPKRANFLSTMKFIGIRTKILRMGIPNKLQIITKGRNILSLDMVLKNTILRVVRDFFSESLHRRLLEQEIRKIRLIGLTLDIGSKNRRYDSYFPDAKIIALDINPQLKDGSIIQCDARDICFKDISFVNIISFEVFEYIYETEEILKEAKRVLKPGGICYFSVPFLNPVHGGMGDIVRYTKRGWEELLQRYFDKIEIKSFGGRYSIIFDFWFDKIRKSNIFIKLLFLLPAAIIKKICFLLDKKEKSERYIMGYFVRVEK